MTDNITDLSAYRDGKVVTESWRVIDDGHKLEVVGTLTDRSAIVKLIERLSAALNHPSRR